MSTHKVHYSTEGDIAFCGIENPKAWTSFFRGTRTQPEITCKNCIRILRKAGMRG